MHDPCNGIIRLVAHTVQVEWATGVHRIQRDSDGARLWQATTTDAATATAAVVAQFGPVGRVERRLLHITQINVIDCHAPVVPVAKPWPPPPALPPRSDLDALRCYSVFGTGEASLQSANDARTTIVEHDNVVHCV